jgi:nitrate/nitrite-specific signal transduction histidine kinase
MRERAETVGATVEVESRPGGGASVRLAWRDPSVARPSPQASEVLV